MNILPLQGDSPPLETRLLHTTRRDLFCSFKVINEPSKMTYNQSLLVDVCDMCTESIQIRERGITYVWYRSVLVQVTSSYDTLLRP